MNEFFSELKAKFGASFTEAEVKNRTLGLLVDIGAGKQFDFVRILSEKNFRMIFLSNDNSSFITTDNPVVRFNKSDADGIGIHTTEIYFPISQRCLAFLHGRGDKFEYMSLSNRKLVFELNTFMASKAKYFIIARDRDYLIKILEKLNYAF
jgi:hypothetical protein